MMKWKLSREIFIFLMASDALWWAFSKFCVYPVEKVVTARRHWVFRKLEKKLKLEKMIVQAGPFQGMKYPGMKATCSVILPKLLGTYELELAHVIEDYVAQEFPLVVDIGCAEGYYAVGMALRLPRARVLAYDISPEAQALCREMVHVNQVENRVTILSECSEECLLKLDFSGGGLIICDCEGYEADLFNEVLAQHLRNAHLLIELHDFMRSGVTEVIEKAFVQTHDLRIVHSLDDAQKARRYQSSLVSPTDKFERQLAFTELRYEVMHWAVLTPKKEVGEIKKVV
jgi:SAM-dependent methyltransferase